MKSISTALSNHLDGEVTTLASCWRVVRRDGQVFRFTDHDQDLTISGEVYQAESSYTRTAVASASDFSVANLEVTGILDADVLNDDDMRNGLFNRADVYIFLVNWADTTQGILKVRRGWFGEVTLLGNGTFVTEIRGLAEALSHNYIEVYSTICRADFCDARCKLNIADFEVNGTVATSVARDTLTLTSGFVVPSHGLGFGTVRFLDGENAGRVIEIIGYDVATRRVDLFEGAAYPILPGATLKVAPGCDRSLTKCISYNNVINRRAEDFIPGNDDMMSYPNAK